MPLIAPRTRGRRATVKVELDGETRRLLKLYSKFSSNDPDRVIEGALAMLFAQDSDFGPWVAGRTAEQTSQDLHTETDAQLGVDTAA